MTPGYDQDGFSWPLSFFFVWMVVVSIASIQNIFPIYGTIRLRELTTGVLMLLAILQKRSRNNDEVWLLAYGVFLCVFVNVARSDAYDLETQLRLVTRLTILFCSVPAIIAFVRTETEARRVFVFMLLLCGLLALSGPLQEATGQIPWLSEEDNWALAHGRAGFARYLSLLGDPNVGAMCGGLLPLVTMHLHTENRRPKFVWLALSIIINFSAVALVAYSVSQAGLFLLIGTFLCVWWKERESWRWHILQLSIIAAVTLAAVPDLTNRMVGIFENASASASMQQLSGPGWLPYSSKLLADLDFRLFSYLDINDSVLKVLFGSGYNVVVPGSYYNPLGVLAHNAYKEIYLNGGLLGLSLFGLLFVLTGIRAVRLVRRIDLSPDSCRLVWAIAVAYFELLIIMFTFPVYHYTGIGLVFWGCVGLVHALYVYFMKTSPVTV